MNPERFARLREILLTAPRLARSEQQSYVARVCDGDPELRREAESLLAWADRDNGAKAARTGGALDLLPTPADEARVAIPEAIGPYRVLGVLGTGGMGVVYRAEQSHPLRREVAVKLCRSGLRHRSVLARFDAERQALASMDHPGIAKALDAGEHEDGRPYFVMELVRGVPITEYCVSNSLSLRQRLDLFREVCDAVEHAHRKGILHRDLKPSNVLVTKQTGPPAVKVIDFGIAKATDERVTGVPITLEGQLIGTLEYMSPEQASGRLAEMDTRSDVYSLGVILYELVSGRLPYETQGKPLLEAVRVVARTEPAPLSHGSSRRERIDDDVGTIVRRALEKEPGLRYGSAAALGEDVERFLRGYPILARPPSAIYQIRKLVARNKVPSTLAASILVLLMGFAVTMSVLFRSQSRERSRAEAEAAKAREVSGFLHDMLAAVETQGRQVTVRELLDLASRDVAAKFQDRSDVEAALHGTIGSAYVALGDFEEAERHLRSSLETRRALYGAQHLEVGQSLADLSEYYRRLSVDPVHQMKADSLARAALEIRTSLLGEDHPEVAATIALCAEACFGLRRFEEADSLYGVAIGILERRPAEQHPEVVEYLHRRAVARMWARQGNYDAGPDLQEALEMSQRLRPGDHVQTAAILLDLVEVGRGIGRAETAGLECLAMSRRLWGDGHPNLIGPLGALGVEYAYQWRFEEGEPLLREALAIAEAEFDASSEVVANASNSLAALLDRKGEWAEAETLYRRALRIWLERMGPSHFRTFLGRANLARCLDRLGRDDESWAMYREGLALAETKEGPDSGMAAMYLHRMASFLSRRGRFEEAERMARRAVTILEATWGPQGRPANGNWTSSLESLANALHGLGRLEEAEQAHRRADTAYRAGGRLRESGVPNLVGLGSCVRDQGRLEEAEPLLRVAEEMFRTRVGVAHPDYADALLALGILRADQGRRREARALLAPGRELLRSTAFPGDRRLAIFDATLARVR